MAHFAKVVDGLVTKVIVAEPEFFDTFIDDTAGKWIQTSYNTRGGVHYDPQTGEPDDGVPLRMNYAGLGFSYDKEKDAFIPPKPYESWVLDESTCLWEAPVERPTDGAVYYWDEETLSWVIDPTRN